MSNDECFYIEIVSWNPDDENEEGKVEERRGPFSEWKANKVDDGLNINLDHSRFFTRIVEDVG